MGFERRLGSWQREVVKNDLDLISQHAAPQHSAPPHRAAPRPATQRRNDKNGNDKMRSATASLKSAAPYSQSREYASEVPMLNREAHDAYDIRTWREHCHTMPDGHIFIPPMAFKFALDKGAKMLGIKKAGSRGATMTKYFEAGVLVMEPVVLPDKKENVLSDKIYCHANGKRGSGTRVWRRFPRIDQWLGKVEFNVLADEITPDVFETALRQAGAFVGIGRFRPEAPIGGFYGRFEVVEIAW